MALERVASTSKQSVARALACSRTYSRRELMLIALGTICPGCIYTDGYPAGESPGPPSVQRREKARILKSLTPYTSITSDAWPIRESVSRHLDPRRYDKLAAVPGQIAWLASANMMYEHRSHPLNDLSTLGMLTAVDQELLGKGYRVASRSDINALLTETGLSIANLTDSDAIRFGRLLAVQGVLIIRIPEATVTEIAFPHTTMAPRREILGHAVAVSMEQRIVDVESGELAWSASQSVNGRFSGLPSEHQLYIDICQHLGTKIPARN